MYPSEDPNRSPYWDVYGLGYKQTTQKLIKEQDDNVVDDTKFFETVNAGASYKELQDFVRESDLEKKWQIKVLNNAHRKNNGNFTYKTMSFEESVITQEQRQDKGRDAYHISLQ